MTDTIRTRQWRTVYKLTDPQSMTRAGCPNACQWGEGVTNPHGVKSGQDDLCSSDWYHAYTSPELAVLLNPIHADIPNPVLWRAEVRGTIKTDKGLKLGATEMRTVERIPLPTFTRDQRAAFAIYCARASMAERGVTIPERDQWAEAWLAGDRSAAAIFAAADAARAVRSAYAADPDALLADAVAFALRYEVPRAD